MAFWAKRLGGSVLARLAHGQKVSGSNPFLATYYATSVLAGILLLEICWRNELMRALLILVALASLAGCTVKAPIKGQMSTGEAITGIATGSMSGGTVEVMVENGPSCHGPYNAKSRARELSVHLTCDNGTTALAQVSRAPDLMSGQGTFETSDGRAGTFIYE